MFRRAWWDKHISTVVGFGFGILFMTHGLGGWFGVVYYITLAMVILMIVFMIVAIVLPKGWYEKRRNG